MNGCLLGILEIFGDVIFFLLVLSLAPYVAFLLLCWWFVAWILGLIFPGKEFFPAQKMWARLSAWFKRRTGKDLPEVLFFSAVFIILGAAISWMAGLLFGRR